MPMMTIRLTEFWFILKLIQWINTELPSVLHIFCILVFLLIFQKGIRCPMALPLQEVERLKRKLRKKLRQIENLEIVDRELNNEELDKISKKSDIRQELNDLIKETEAEVDNSFTFIDKTDLDNSVVPPTRTANEQVGFWELDNSESSEEMKRKSVELETECSDIIAEKKPHIEDVEKKSDKENSITNESAFNKKLSKIESSSNQSVADNKISKTDPVNNENSPNKKPSSTETTHVKVAVSKNLAERGTISETCKAPQKQPSKPAAAKSKVASELSKWRNVSWSCEELCGHDDLVLDCDVEPDLDLALTCSRDTTVKVSIDTMYSTTFPLVSYK